MTPESAEKFVMIRRRVTSLVLVFVALFMLLSLVTFTSTDLPQTHWPVTGAFRNVCGKLGAQLAQWLFFNFGVASYLAVALAVGFAIRCRPSATCSTPG